MLVDVKSLPLRPLVTWQRMWKVCTRFCVHYVMENLHCPLSSPLKWFSEHRTTWTPRSFPTLPVMDSSAVQNSIKVPCQSGILPNLTRHGFISCTELNQGSVPVLDGEVRESPPLQRCPESLQTPWQCWEQWAETVLMFAFHFARSDHCRNPWDRSSLIIASNAAPPCQMVWVLKPVTSELSVSISPISFVCCRCLRRWMASWVDGWTAISMTSSLGTWPSCMWWRDAARCSSVSGPLHLRSSVPPLSASKSSTAISWHTHAYWGSTYRCF